MIGVSLAGYPLDARRGANFSWRLSYGVDAYSTSVTLSESLAQAIWAKGKQAFGPDTGQRKLGLTNATTRLRGPQPTGIDLVFSNGNTEVTCQGIQVISIREGEDPYTKTLVLADRRWALRRTFMERSYNMRRHGTKRRLVGGTVVNVPGFSAGLPIQLQPNAADFIYRRSTLLGGKAWTAKEVLADVLTELVGTGNFVIDPSLKLQDSIEDLELHDPGDVALARVLDFLPGAQCYVGLDGKLHVTSEYNQEGLLATLSQAPAPEAGQWQVVDRSAFRPKIYTVYFDRQVELRFDYSEGVTSTRVKGEEPLECENVIQNPLYQLYVPGRGDVTQGEWVPVREFLLAMNSKTRAGIFSGTIDEHLLREKWLGLWNNLVYTVAFNISTQQFDPEWAALMHALRNHWRQSYRLLPQWRDKVRRLLPNRTAIIDVENGVQAPATCHTEYVTKWAVLALSDPTVDIKLGFQRSDYAADISQATVSPFRVTVEDSDQGIFRIQAALDQTGLVETFVPGTATTELPSAKAGDIIGIWPQIALSPTFRLAVVLSATQDSPNSVERMEAVNVTPAQAAKVLGVPAAAESRGPDHEIFSGLRRARYAWIDSLAEKIRAAFYRGEPYPKQALINEDDLVAAAQAAAAREYARALDRPQGTFETFLYKVEPQGALSDVTFVVQLGGEVGATVTTVWDMPDPSSPRNVYALLPEDVRRKVRGLVTSD